MGIKSDVEIAFRNAKPFMAFFEEAARRHQVKISALLAVASRETNCRNITGDGGHGRGIMQIDDRYHKDFVNDPANKGGLNPETNILYGAYLLKFNLDHFNGDHQKAFAAYNCGIGNVTKAIQRGLPASAYTTGKNYGTDVYLRMEIMESLLAHKE